MYGNISDWGVGSYPPQVALTLRTPGWGVHTVGGGIDLGDHRFRPRFVGVVMYGKIFLIRGWDPILPGWRWPYKPQVGVSTPCRAVSTRETTVFHPRFVAVVDVWKDS